MKCKKTNKSIICCNFVIRIPYDLSLSNSYHIRSRRISGYYERKLCHNIIYNLYKNSDIIFHSEHNVDNCTDFIVI